MAFGHHECGRVLARDERRAHAGVDHFPPALARLIPERHGPGEAAFGIDHLLVPAPRVVDENVQTALLGRNPLEHAADRAVVGMVTGNAEHRRLEIRAGNRAAGRVDDRP